MDLELFLGEKRWEILSALSKGALSPLELSKRIGTSVSYVSQQLKLLEVSGYVNKRKTGFVEKDRPRNIYFISDAFLFCVFVDKQDAFRKKMKLDLHKKILLKLWSLDEKYHIPFEKFFLELRDFLGKIDGVFLRQQSMEELIVVSGEKEAQKKVGRAKKNSLLGMRIKVVEKQDPSFFEDCFCFYSNGADLGD